MTPIKLDYTQTPSLKRDSLILAGHQPCPLACPFLAIHSSPLPDMRIGNYLCDQQDNNIFQVTQILRLSELSGKTNHFFLLHCLTELSPRDFPLELTVRQKGFSLAWITLSDKGAAGLRNDSSGPLIPELIARQLKICFTLGQVLPDDRSLLSAALADLSLLQKADLVVTTGGTGVTSRDIAPEATLDCIQRRLPGFEQAMMQASLQKTPRAVISRAVAGISNRTLIINLPGSPKAVQENLTPILPALKHTLEKINDSPRDCAQG